MKRYYLLASGLALAIGLSGCGGGEQNQRAAAPSHSDPLATVNGQTITQEQFEFHLERRTGGQPQLASPEDRQVLLDELVELTLLASDAEERGLMNDPVVAGRVTNLRNAVLAQALVEQTERQAVSEDELRAEYERRYANGDQQEYHASHILVEDEEQARQLIEQIDQGADFAELAAEHSIDPGTGPRGGDLGWFQPGDMVEPFSQALQQLEPEQHTAEPVQTQFGWHVIRLEATREAEAPEFARVEPNLRQMLAQQRIEQQLDTLRAQSNIEILRQP